MIPARPTLLFAALLLPRPASAQIADVRAASSARPSGAMPFASASGAAVPGLPVWSGAAAGPSLPGLVSALMPVLSAPLEASALAAPLSQASAPSGIILSEPARPSDGLEPPRINGTTAEIETAKSRAKVLEAKIQREAFGGRPDDNVEFAPEAAPAHAGLGAASDAAVRIEAPISRAMPPPPASGGKDAPLLRLATGIGLVVAQAALIHRGGAAFTAFAAGISALMLFEYGAMLAHGGRPVQRVNAILAGAGLALAAALSLPAGAALTAAATLVVSRELFRADRSFDRAALTLAGAVLLGWLPGHLALVRGLEPHGEVFAFMYFAGIWATDTFAYVVGKTFGRHKLAPTLSPKKTWEGAAGGLAAAAATVSVFVYAIPGLLSWPAAALLVAAIGAAGQISGFAASMIKRSVGVKDSGNLLPGHGGFLDRFDSFVFTAPLVYWLLALLK